MPTYTNYRDQSLVVTHLITKDEALKLQPVWTDIEHADGCYEKEQDYVVGDFICLPVCRNIFFYKGECG